ncbi:MAG TPA: UdgX family uracil-DNA binding protein [Actinomycetota bacterium]
MTRGSGGPEPEENRAGGIGSAEDLIDANAPLGEIAEASKECKACRLFARATQTVFGEGTEDAQVVMVGEQPGDHEDVEGRPFVGPAGQLLDRALEEAGIDRTKVYITNVVKHFKWEPKGKRRIHKKPAADEIAACRPWLNAELERLKPKVVVCLGATAAQALIGRTFRVTQQRGQFLETTFAPVVTATVHPSSILRAPDEETRDMEMKLFIQDLAKVARRLSKQTSAE